MGKMKKNAIVVGAVAVLLAISVAVGMLLSGSFAVLGADGSRTGGESNPVGVEEKMAAAARPEAFSGIWISKEDIVIESGSTRAQAQSAVDAAVTKLADGGFNAVLADFLDENLACAGLTCSDGEFNMLSALLSSAKAQGIYTALVVDAESADGAAALEKLAGEESFDCLLLTNPDLSAENVKLLANAARKKIDSLALALACNEENTAEFSALLSKDTNDFLLSMPSNYDEAGEGYIAALGALDEAARKNNIDFTAIVRLDLLEKNSGSEAAAEAISQLVACDELINCFGSVIFGYPLISGENPVAVTVMQYLSDRNTAALEKDFELRNFNSAKKSINESKFTFSGSSSPLYDLKLNGKDVEREANGDFSFEVELKAGDNSFEFEHKGATHKYTVTYEMKILESVSPTGSVSAPGKSSINITAIAMKGAKVYARINGVTVNMSEASGAVLGEEGTELDESSDFAQFVGKYTLPAGTTKEQSLGSIKVYAGYNGLSASLDGASVKVSAETPVFVEPGEAQEPSSGTTGSTGGSTEGGGATEGSSGSTSSGVNFDPSKMLTPYSYAGVSGKSKMCEITTLCETMPASVVDDCVPYSSPLPVGTFDYITSEYTYGGSKYYRLASGKNILASRAKLISSGYNLPLSRVMAVSSTVQSGSTQLKFGFDWKIPFNISIKNQSYIPQSQAYGNSLYAVSNFDGKYLDIVFYHALNVSGTINVSSSKIVSAAQWLSDSSEHTVTLRLTLRNAGKFYGFNIGYTSDGCLTLTIKNKPSTRLRGSVIMIDPGHGGTDSGAICAYNPNSSSKYEKQINLQLALKIKSKLEAAGATVIMTRTDDSTMSLDQRVAVTRQKNPDLFIAVHCDSSTSATPMGTSAYYYQPYSYPLAAAVHKSIVNAYKSDIYANSSSVNLNKVSRGANMYPFRVTRVEECPAILVEYGFISNINECKLLWNSSVQNKLAQATVDGIEDYISAS